MQDPLADTEICLRDIAQFKKLGVNTIRVYTTDNSANHDECMKALADAGIYVIIDANNPLYSINRLDPAPSYNTKYLQSVFASVDEFIKYDNTLAFFSGNEVINDNVKSTKSARYVKAVTRDMRAYIKSRGYRAAPVGYSAADVAQNRMQLAHYMNCGTEDERSDFFAFVSILFAGCSLPNPVPNAYRTTILGATPTLNNPAGTKRSKTSPTTASPSCKPSPTDSPASPLTLYSLSEYGCTTNGRDFGEVAALMSDKMTPVYSGGLLYEYALEDNGFGIAKIPSPKAKDIEKKEGFDKFAKALKQNPAPQGDGGYTSTTRAVACPTKDSNWLVDSTLLPAIPEGAKKVCLFPYMSLYGWLVRCR